MKKAINFLKEFTYRPRMSNFIWKLHLANISRKIYFYLNKPTNGIISLTVGGVSSDFHVYTPWELRALEPSGKIGNEKHILELLISKVNAGDIVYDVGSNLGVFSILLAKKVGTKGVVVAFEPETQTFSHLQDNIKLNNFNNVKAFNLALAECDKDAELYLGQVTGACSLVKQADGGHGFQKVKVRKGDSFVTKEKLPLPNLVKIDVEGAEYDVIKGLQETLSESACKFVCCEVHTQALPSGKRPDDIFNLLKSLGFNKIEKYERGTDEFHILAQKL